MRKILIAVALCLCIGALTACYGDPTSPTTDSVNATQSTEIHSSSTDKESEESAPSYDSEETSSDAPENSETGNGKDEESATPQDSTETELPPTDVCKITFVQEDAQTITRYVNKGETLIDIPSLQPITGYDVAWSVTDFTNVTKNLEVTVVKTPKTYTVTYKVESGVIISSKVQKIAYESEYTLLIPKRTDYEFRGWKIESTGETFASEGRYTLAGDIVLVPIWRWIEGAWVT